MGGNVQVPFLTKFIQTQKMHCILRDKSINSACSGSLTKLATQDSTPEPNDAVAVFLK
ncbi:MAG: hypothetical protein ABJ310_04590 [Roseobacter sp.]